MEAQSVQGPIDLIKIRFDNRIRAVNPMVPALA